EGRAPALASSWGLARAWPAARQTSPQRRFFRPKAANLPPRVHCEPYNRDNRGLSNPMGVIAVTSLLLEARIATGPGVSVICGHASQLVSCLQAAIKRGALGVISFGVAGGLAPHLAPGDWVIRSGVRTGHERYPTDRRWSSRLLEAIPGSVHGEIAGADAPIADAAEKIGLHALTGAMAVDMESHVAAKVAALHNIPFACSPQYPFALLPHGYDPGGRGPATSRRNRFASRPHTRRAGYFALSYSPAESDPGTRAHCNRCLDHPQGSALGPAPAGRGAK